jgi:MGT family glycosyltransferase
MHIVFCISPFNGHVNTSLAVVSELARRGHRVSYATTAEFSRAARDAGGRAVVYGTTMRPPQGGLAIPQDAAGHDFARGHDGQLRELTAVLPALIAAFAGDPPDVVVCDPMCWAGRALAARCRVPVINNVTIMISSTRWSLGPVSASFNPADSRLPQLFAATSAVLARYGTGLTADHLLGTGGMVPTIVYLPRAFQPQGDQFGPSVHFIGPCLSSRPGIPRSGPAHGRGWRPPGDGPVVLVSLGTVFNRKPALFRQCIDAFADSGCHVVAALGGLDAADLGPLPAYAQAHSYLQLTDVLPFADVLVGHAGMASTMEALSFGVPIVAMPQMPEQRINADRLAELGLGLCLEPARQTGEAVRRAVTALAHDVGIRPRLEWMRTEIERAPGAAAAAEVVEESTDRPWAEPAGLTAR